MDTTQPLVLQKFDMSQIRPNENVQDTLKGGFKIAIIGKPGLGKTTLIKQLVYSKRFLIPAAVVFSGSEEANGFYGKIIPSCFIYNQYTPSVLEKILERQVYAKKHKLPNSWLLIIFDDCMHNTKQFMGETMLKLFKNGRHYNILTLFTSQYVLDLKPVLRSLLDGIFLFKEQNKMTLDRIYANFGGAIPTRGEFVHILSSVTSQPYHCLYIDNASCNTKAWEECLYWFKASLVPDFKFGCELFQQGINNYTADK